MTINTLPIENYLQELQQKICDELSTIDNFKQFNHEPWQRDKNNESIIYGSGITRVIANGAVFNKGGVNYSHVFGDKLPASASAKRPDLVDANFEALGVSVVIHPQNPYIPTSHMNVRLFIATKTNGEQIWWFGGGFDLTPYYIFVDDCKLWHQHAFNACIPFGADVYPKFKEACDRYFYLPHRNETRGIGGIFFDDLNQWDFATCSKFIQAVGNTYLTAYKHICKLRKNMTFSAKEIHFQQFRRGRYVEFNLLYDRGTLFGLNSGGRIESILMSLPPVVRWEYDYKIPPNSAESKLYEYLKPINWLEI